MNNIDKLVHFTNNNNNNLNTIDLNISNYTNNNTTALIDTNYSTINTNNFIKNFKIDQQSEIRNEIELRNLCAEDIPDLKQLCAEWFPVE